MYDHMLQKHSAFANPMAGGPRTAAGSAPEERVTPLCQTTYMKYHHASGSSFPPISRAPQADPPPGESGRLILEAPAFKGRLSGALNGMVMARPVNILFGPQ